MSARRVSGLVVAGFREYVRTPILLVLLVVVPADLVGVVVRESTAMTVPITLANAGTVRVMLPDVTGAFMAPMATALVAGVFGLFVMRNALDADGRVTVAGYRSHEVVLARLGVLALACLVVTAVAVGVLLTQFRPEYPAAFAIATFLSALAYGMIGALLGLRVDWLAGVYALLFLPAVDILLFQNPIAERSLAGTELLPGHFVTTAAIDAGFGAGFDYAPLAFAAGYVALLAAATALAFRRTVRRA